MSIDITNVRFGSLVALRQVGINKHKTEIWLCQCDCGNTKEVQKGNLLGGYSKTCGKRALHVDNLIGRRFGSLVVTALYGITDHRISIWECKCDCGEITRVRRGNLISGDIKSCGCSKTRIQIGDVFGKWTVLDYSCSISVSNGTVVYWWCSCMCGLVKELKASALTSGGTNSCKHCASTIHGQSRTVEYTRARNRIRQDKAKQLDVDWSFEKEKALKALYSVCVVCGSSDKLCIDHVYPVNRGYGLCIGNACILCNTCNLKKSDKLPENLPPEMRDRILSAAAEFKEAWESGYRA